MTIQSVGHLREICRRREFFLHDMRTRHGVSDSRPHQFSKQVSELEVEEEMAPEVAEFEEVSEVNLTCWNCRQPGHRYQDCIAERSIFCYGCGTPQTYKPSCQKCNANPKNFRQNAPKGASKLNHSQQMSN